MKMVCFLIPLTGFEAISKYLEYKFDLRLLECGFIGDINS